MKRPAFGLLALIGVPLFIQICLFNSNSNAAGLLTKLTKAKLPDGRPAVIWSGTSREIGNDQNYIKELNITKAETNVNWRFVENTKGVYDFEKIHEVVDILKQNGINEISLAIFPENPLYNDVQVTQNTVPQNEMQWTAYKNFLTALVNDFKNDAQFYQIVREINPARFLGTAEDYSKFLVFSSNTIKAIDPKAKIIFAALPYELCINSDRENFLADVIKCLPNDKKYFDAIDIHLHRLPENQEIVLSVNNGSDYVGKAYDYFHNQLSGTIYKDSLVFFETSSYSAEKGDIDDSLIQTEEEQAQDLQNRLTVLAEKGAYCINLEGGIFQRKFFMFSAEGQVMAGSFQGKKNPLKYFECTGLIWNPKVNDGKIGKKKAFDIVKNWNKK